MNKEEKYYKIILNKKNLKFKLLIHLLVKILI